MKKPVPKREKTILDCLSSQENCRQKLQMILYPLRLHLRFFISSLVSWLFGLTFQLELATLTVVSKIIILSTGPSSQHDTSLNEPELIVQNGQIQFPISSAVLGKDQDCSHVVGLIGFMGENCHHKNQTNWKPTVSSFV